MKNLFKTEQSGRSMVEMLGVLAIIGVLSVGGIAGYSKAMAKYKTTQTLDQLTMLVANIRTAFSGPRSRRAGRWSGHCKGRQSGQGWQRYELVQQGMGQEFQYS